MFVAWVTDSHLIDSYAFLKAALQRLTAESKMGWVVIDLHLTDTGYDMVATTPNRAGGYIEVGIVLSHKEVRDSGGGLWALIFMAQEALCCEAIHKDEE